jgi:polysaccharide deacetylase 2 family uncharacterized protein YibQ
MRGLATVAVVVVCGLAGLAVWLALGNRSSRPRVTAPNDGPAAVVTLPATATPRPKADKPRPALLDPALVEDGRWGPLPRVGPKGRKPWRAYARRFRNPDRRPRVAVIVTGLGQQAALTTAALKGLPGPVTLAFSAYAADLYGWAKQARAGGHEILIELPMAPRKPAHGDAGPKALRASLGADANRDRLHWVLSRFVGYVGVIGTRGGGLSAQTASVAPVLDEVLQRGLIYVRPRPSSVDAAQASARTGIVHVDLWLDTMLEPNAVDRRMRLAEALARGRGWVVAAVRAYPMTVDAVRHWVQALKDRDLIAAPLSAVALPAK